MRPWRADGPAGLALAASLLAGCAFGDGQPWGRAELSLAAGFAPPAERVTDDGLLRTTDGFGVRLDAVELRFAAVALRVAAADEAAGDPDGEHCHDGHCHGEAHLEAHAGPADGAAPRVVRPATAGFVPLAADPAPVPLGPCADPCHLPRGAVTAVEVEVAEARLAGRVFDRRAAPALHAAGVPFTATVPLALTLTAPLDERVGPGEPPGLAVAVAFELPAAVFDGLDFAGLLPASADAPVALGATAAFREVVAHHLAHDGPLTVHVDRFDP